MVLLAILPFIFDGILGGLEFYEYVFAIWAVPNPPKPKVTYGEFPFTFVYEINGVKKIITDTLICEYDGMDTYGGIPNKRREWKYSFKSGNKILILLQLDGTNVIYYDIPTYPETQMGDGEPWDGYVSKDAWHYNTKENPNYIGRGYSVSEEELLNKYAIRIISWEIAPPIENSFE